MIWPAVSLNHSTQYLVALRNLRTINSDPVQPSHAFLALRSFYYNNSLDIQMVAMKGVLVIFFYELFTLKCN